MRLKMTTLVFLMAIAIPVAAKADDAPKRSPELQVLDRFVGTWDLKATEKPAGGEATTFDVVSFRRWSQGGNFVVFEDPGQEEVNLPITYDPESKTYPGVIMIGAFSGLVTGTWDKDKKIMSFTIKHPNKTEYRGTHRFLREDYAEASGSVTDADGKVVVELSWKQTRRKK
jgi:hypothetical protein